MIIGVTLLKRSGGSYESPTFGRQGLAAVFAVNILKITATSLAIDVEHKNIEDTSWTTLGSFSSITATGVKTASLTGVKEQVRLVYTITASNAYDGVHLDVLAPTWMPY